MLCFSDLLDTMEWVVATEAWWQKGKIMDVSTGSPDHSDSTVYQLEAICIVKLLWWKYRIWTYKTPLILHSLPSWSHMFLNHYGVYAGFNQLNTLSPIVFFVFCFFLYSRFFKCFTTQYHKHIKCHAEYFHVLHSSIFFNHVNLIRWLHQKPADLDL